MAVPERSDRHDVEAEGTVKRREDGPAAAEGLRPASHPPFTHRTKASILSLLASQHSAIKLFSYSAIQLFSYSAIQLFSYSAMLTQTKKAAISEMAALTILALIDHSSRYQ
ncbi:hypothetical protein ACCY16_24250 [Candidatus Pantoea formicae]|uniref:hypothetical protein n=1 Tax=Candidatus Pantoea formicae TaxID=2608355 RepID=UPI003ED9D9A3